MCKAKINLISPAGVPVALEFGAEDTGKEIAKLLDRADEIGQYLTGKGWAFGDTQAQGPSATELDGTPTFAGYPCSPTIDTNGLPSWILHNGKQALRREKQGDVWYSIKHGNGEFEVVLTIRKGEIVPLVKGL